jgi:hypothetical protein
MIGGLQRPPCCVALGARGVVAFAVKDPLVWYHCGPSHCGLAFGHFCFPYSKGGNSMFNGATVDCESGEGVCSGNSRTKGAACCLALACASD